LERGGRRGRRGKQEGKGREEEWMGKGRREGRWLDEEEKEKSDHGVGLKLSMNENEKEVKFKLEEVGSNLLHSIRGGTLIGIESWCFAVRGERYDQ
jgi:hypothetical protein